MKTQTFGLVLLLSAAPGYAQDPPAPPAAPAPDTPSISVGVTLFADYTFIQQPKITDAEGNDVTPSAFQITRSYINVTGNVTRHVVFRITPDIARETGVGSSLNGSYTFRLKFAYAQWNLDDHLPAGSFARLGMQPNPYFELMEPLYRYRFQGTTVQRAGGLSGVGRRRRRVPLRRCPNDYGDIQTGFFNGEGLQPGGGQRPEGLHVPRHRAAGSPGTRSLRGLRLTGFINKDAYVKNADRTRGIFAASFEHPYLNAAFEYLTTKDQKTDDRHRDRRPRMVRLRHAEDREGLGRPPAIRPSHAEQGPVEPGPEADDCGSRLLVRAPGEPHQRAAVRRRQCPIRRIFTGPRDRAPDRRPLAPDFLSSTRCLTRR